MKTIKSYHNAKQNTRELVTLYAELIAKRKDFRMIVQMDREDDYYMVQLNNDDGTEFTDGIRCWITSTRDDEYNGNCLDDVEALVKLDALLGHDNFREAWLETF